MKKNSTFSKLVMLVIMAVLPLSMMAQEGQKKSKPAEKYWYIQADGGLSINHGDLANYNGGIWDDFNHFTSMAFQNWNAHLGVGYQFGKVIGLNFKGGYGLLSGHKHNQALVFAEGIDGTYYNLSLDKTNYIEGNLNLTFNLFNMFNYNPRRVINIVPHVGFGGIYYQAGAVSHLDGSDEPETPAMAEKKADRQLNFTVPVGAEFTFNVAPKFDIFIDYTYLFTGTDYLDQVMKVAADEEKHIINDKDMYSQLNLGLRYKFNNPCDIEKMARESSRITYRVNPDPLVEGEDGKVCFDVIVTVPGEYFEKEAVMNLKPYLAYNGGQIEIDPITFIGEKVNTSDSYDFQVNYKDGGEFTKHYCIDYKPEMANSELKGDPMFYVYDGTIYPTQDEIVRNVYFTQGATEHLANGVQHFEKPGEPEPVYDTITKERAVLQAVYFFNKDRWDINGRRKLNNEADAVVRGLLNNGEKRFEIRGWASPEGEEDHNNGLSHKRAQTAEDQLRGLIKKAKVENVDITAKGNGEGLDLFRQYIANSNLKDKDAILNVYDNARDKVAAAEELCNIYDLEKDILPQIRRAEIYTFETYQEVVRVK